MAEKYLNASGVQHLWSLIKNEDKIISDKVDKVRVSEQSDPEGGKVITITDSNNQSVTINTTDFIKDGMLKDVSISTPEKLGYPIVYNGVTYSHLKEETKNVQFLVFTWNITDTEGDENSTHAGVKVDFLKIDEFAKVYDADGKSIELVGNTFSVKEVKTDITKTKGTIPVAGGPLASEAVQNAFPGGIPAGTSMEDILMALLCKEKMPTAKVEKPTMVSRLSSPTVSLSQSGEVEVGTIITVNETTGNALNVTTTARDYSGFIYGHATSLEGPIITEPKDPKDVAVPTPTPISGDFSLTRTYTGNFSGDNVANIKHTDTKLDSPSSCLCPSVQNITVGDGKCTVSATISGPGHTATCPKSPKYYVVSNLNKVYDIKPENVEGSVVKIEAQGPDSLTNKTAINGSNSASVTGVRYMFIGAAAEPVELNSVNIRALKNGTVKKATAGDYTIKSTVSGVKHFIIAVPEDSGLTLTSAKNATSMNNEEVSKFGEPQKIEVEGANGYTAKTYNVWSFISDAAWKGDKVAYNITLSK